jgi:hypothetical protein
MLSLLKYYCYNCCESHLHVHLKYMISCIVNAEYIRSLSYQLHVTYSRSSRICADDLILHSLLSGLVHVTKREVSYFSRMGSMQAQKCDPFTLHPTPK